MELDGRFWVGVVVGAVQHEADEEKGDRGNSNELSINQNQFQAPLLLIRLANVFLCAVSLSLAGWISGGRMRRRRRQRRRWQPSK